MSKDRYIVKNAPLPAPLSLLSPMYYPFLSYYLPLSFAVFNFYISHSPPSLSDTHIHFLW